jgi:hypothetical protein
MDWGSHWVRIGHSAGYRTQFLRWRIDKPGIHRVRQTQELGRDQAGLAEHKPAHNGA